MPPRALLQFFAWGHLPLKTQHAARLFADVAHALSEMDEAKLATDGVSLVRKLGWEFQAISPPNAESTWALVKTGAAARALPDLGRALRTLLEGRDAALRAYSYKEP